MDFDNINVKDFKTLLYRLSFTSTRYRLLDDDCMSFEKNKNEVMTFDHNKINELLKTYKKVKIYDFDEDEYKDFKKLGYDHNKVKNKISVLKFDDTFFKLEGKKYSKLRYYRNYYTKKVPIEIKDEPNNIDEVIEFIHQWKEIRKNAYFQMFTGYDINFLQKYYQKHKNDIISKFFYYDGKLVGYYIVNIINKNLYNQLFRKVNVNMSHLNLYIDYMCFKEIYDRIGESFLINLEGDVGCKGLYEYKTENFPIYKIFPSIDVKIKAIDKYEELF